MFKLLDSSMASAKFCLFELEVGIIRAFVGATLAHKVATTAESNPPLNPTTKPLALELLR